MQSFAVKIYGSTTYAIWAGIGIVLVALVDAILYKQIPDIPAVIGNLSPAGKPVYLGSIKSTL
jgi:multidrug transporter EmrE-like cation transporter